MADREKLKRAELLNKIKTARTMAERKKIADDFMREPVADAKTYKREALFAFKEHLKQLIVEAHYLQSEGIENIILLGLLNKAEQEIANLIEEFEQEK